jgi:CzcA family heavy metal efflux pump
MLQVLVDPDRMKEEDVTLDDIMEATADSLAVGILFFSEGHSVGSGGWLETANQRMPIQHVSPILYSSANVAPDHLAEVVIKVEDDGPVRLRDVADVVIGHQPMIGDGIINEGPGLLLIVEKYPWGNTLDVTRGVEEALEALKLGLPDIDIDSTIFRPATFVEMSITNLTTALLIGCVLLVVVLFAFLYEWRVALISCIAIPLSLVAAGLVLYYSGATINTMILAGFVIALGDIVDDAIIDIENVVRRLRQQHKEGRGKSLKGMARIILEASLEVRGAIVYATLIEVLAIMPVFFMEGLSGAFFKPLAMSYALALLVSMMVALTVTPALSLIMLRNAPLESRESPIVRWLQRGYAKILAPVIRAPKLAYVTVGTIVLAGVVTWTQLGQSLLPEFKERDFLMHWLTQESTSWPEMNRITIQASKELRSIDGVRNFGAHIGQALIMDEVYGVYFGENWISIRPDVDYDKTINTLQEAVDGYPGLKRDLQTYLKERIREVLTGSPNAITVRIFGPDLAVLRAKADEVKKAMEPIEGLIALKVESQTLIPQIEVEPKMEACRVHGVKPGDIRRATSTLIVGEEVGDIHIANRTYDVNVWSKPELRHSLNSIRELPIDTPSGQMIPLTQVADVQIRPTPNQVKHENLMRSIDIGGNVQGRDLGSVVADVQAALATVDFPLEHHPEILGEFAERQAAASKVNSWAIVAAVGVFLLLHMSFKNVRLAVLAFITLPSALVGGVLAAYLGDGIISLGSLVGFLTVLGIAARNSIMLIDHFQHLERYEGEKFGPNLVLRGAIERISPIMMTALTTALALLPLIIAGSIPGHEVEHPMAIVILGGLITSTLLNLFIVPSLYLRFAASREPIPVLETLSARPATA